MLASKEIIMSSLTNLDELISNVIHSQSRDYMLEAVTAFRSGAYRAAIATIWVSICIDIIEKIRELALEEDGTAIELERQLDNVGTNDLTAKQNFENKLLDYAHSSLQIISNIEKNMLERIKKDRNICVHPMFVEEGEHFEITSKMVRSHIVFACNCLLTQAPVRGKVLRERIYDRINGASFPEDQEAVFVII